MTTRAIRTICVVALVGTSALIGACGGFLTAVAYGFCHDQLLAEHTSSAGRYVASIRYIDCGAVDSGSIRLQVRPAFVPRELLLLPWSPGHIVSIKRRPAIGVFWRSDAELVINLPPGSDRLRPFTWQTWPLSAVAVSLVDGPAAGPPS